ncbi:MAG TPA: hypothetical protein VFW25_05830 [Silvibacterium sp.]|nr:hypothetical protein [Silvibacterium sp.]
MATPQRNFPNPPLRDDSKVADEVGARARYGWVWIVIVILFVLAIWFGVFGWGAYGGWWGGHKVNPPLAQPQSVNNGQPAANEQPAPATSAAVLGGSGVQALTSTDKAGLVGQSFDISNVQVQQKSRNGAFWIGANKTAPMLVVLNRGARNSTWASIAPSNRVNITGVIERAPSAAQARRLWSLNNAQTNRLEQEGAYVQAAEVQVGRH